MMADDSPGKVQTLRAIFAEKNKPIMGMMPPGGKILNQPWRHVVDSNGNADKLNVKIATEQKVSFETKTKVLPNYGKKYTNGDSLTSLNGINTELTNSVFLKPVIGPKPIHLLNQSRTTSLNLSSTPSIGTNKDENSHRTLSDAQKSQEKSKAFGKTIASFMFTNGVNNKENDSVMNDSKINSIPLKPQPRNIQLGTNLENQTEFMNLCNSQTTEVLSNCNLENSCGPLISSDNYVCKGNGNFRRKEIPSLEKLGPAPLKPVKPSFLKFIAKCSSSEPSQCTLNTLQSLSIKPPPLPQKPLQRPSYPCPPRPQTSPPLPPVSLFKSTNSLREEIEELYEDTLLENKRPSSLIPEYTEEEEAEELYSDADVIPEVAPSVPKTPKPKDFPARCQSEYLQPNVHIFTEELYQDAEECSQEEFYEEMPCDALPEEQNSPLYSNNKKEIEKLRREEEKKLRKEQKEREKREKELEKLKKKFGLTGEEIPIDQGLVKADSRGGRGDLLVKKGEIVLILRMEGNPSGRWLVKNEKGKIGYVELTNIEVDPRSVKSVMTIRRLSVISASEELYSEAQSEESIYEVTD